MAMKMGGGLSLRFLALVLAVVFHGSAFANSARGAIDNAIAARDYATAIALIESELDEAPDDAALRFRHARVLSYAGRLSAALAELDALRRQHPDDVDYMLMRARLLDRLDRDDEALEELSRAARLAPEYEAVFRLRHAILLQNQHSLSDSEAVALRDEAARRYPDASWWHPAVVQRRWTIIGGANRDFLSGERSDWNSQFAEAHFEGSQNRYRFRIGRDARFGPADVTFAAGFDRSLASNWNIGADVAAAPDPGFMAEFGFGAHVGRVLDDDWVLDIAYRHRKYQVSRVDSLTGSVERYVGDYRAAYRLTASTLDNSSSFATHSAAIDWYYNDKTSVGLSVSLGEEAEPVGNGSVLRTDVRSVSLSGRRALSRRIVLSWWLGAHDQGDLYRRLFLGMAVSVQI